MASKYKKGTQIQTIASFEHNIANGNHMFMVYFGGSRPKVLHYSFLISWQYRTLSMFICHGRVWVAKKKEGLNNGTCKLRKGKTD